MLTVPHVLIAALPVLPSTNATIARTAMYSLMASAKMKIVARPAAHFAPIPQPVWSAQKIYI